MLDKEEFRQILKMLSLISQLGLIMLSSIAIGFFFGHFIDSLLQFNFIFTALFTIAGVISGFWGIYKQIYSIIDEE